MDPSPREGSTDFRFDDFGSQLVPLPPLIEQAAIVRFKPSSIDWLGDLPRHWETLPFTKCAVDHADYRGATPEKVESGVFLVTAKNIRMGWIDYETSKEYVRADKYEEIMRRGLPKLGDLLLTTEAPLGHVALVDCEEIALAQRIIRFRMDEQRLLPKFALYSMMSPYFQWQLQIRATGSTAEGIKASKLPQLLILRAPIEEQQRIIIWIERNVQRFEQLIEEAQREIDLICEYRSRLITDVVTGKLDVCGVELPQSDETPVLGDLDDSEDVADPAEETDEVEATEEDDAG
jgi:type I restriction enzyme S subunit